MRAEGLESLPNMHSCGLWSDSSWKLRPYTQMLNLSHAQARTGPLSLFQSTFVLFSEIPGCKRDCSPFPVLNLSQYRAQTVWSCTGWCIAVPSEVREYIQACATSSFNLTVPKWLFLSQLSQTKGSFFLWGDETCVADPAPQCQSRKIIHII